jgi:flagellar protein FlgJ
MKLLALLLSFPLWGQSPKDFVAAYYPLAVEVGDRHGVHPEIILTQAALESGWGKNSQGNNFFGIKGRGQLLRTHEYHRTTTVTYPHIFSITETPKGYRYVILDHFKCYDDPLYAFEDFVRVAKKLGKHHCSPKKYFRSLEKYATNPAYHSLLLKVHKIVKQQIKEQCLPM